MCRGDSNLHYWLLEEGSNSWALIKLTYSHVHLWVGPKSPIFTLAYCLFTLSGEPQFESVCLSLVLWFCIWAKDWLPATLADRWGEGQVQRLHAWAARGGFLTLAPQTRHSFHRSGAKGGCSGGFSWAWQASFFKALNSGSWTTPWPWQLSSWQLHEDITRREHRR